MVQLFTIYVFWINVCYIMGISKINILYPDPYENILTHKQKNQQTLVNIIASILWFLTIPFYNLMYLLEWYENILLKKRNYNWWCFMNASDYQYRFELRYGRKIFNYKIKNNDTK